MKPFKIVNGKKVYLTPEEIEQRKKEEALARIPTKEQIKQECQRRLVELVGARDYEHLKIKFANAVARTAELLAKVIDKTITPEEQQELEHLKEMKISFDAIRAKSNELEKTLPEDFTEDKWWK